MKLKLLSLIVLFSSSEKLISMQKAYSGGMMKGDLSQRLLRATKEGNYDLSVTLLERGAELEAINSRKQTALHIATIGGHTALVKLFLSKNAAVNSVDESGSTPLHYAAEKGFTGCGEELIEKNADLLAKDSLGYIPLHKAILEGNARFIKLILKSKKQEQLAAEDDLETSALHLAVLCGHLNCFKIIDAEVFSANPTNNLLMTPLHCAASVGRHEFIRQLGKRALLNAQSRDGRTALHYAVVRENEEHIKTLEELIKLKVNLDIKDKSKKKETALQTALRKGSFVQAELLLAAGANATLEDEEYQSAYDILIPGLILRNEKQLTGDRSKDLAIALQVAQHLKLRTVSTHIQKMYAAESSKKRKLRNSGSQEGLKKLDRKEIDDTL
jgi:ankyrin repeat protein